MVNFWVSLQNYETIYEVEVLKPIKGHLKTKLILLKFWGQKLNKKNIRLTNHTK